MTSSIQRQYLLSLILEACTSGARLHLACQQIGLSCRTVQRWVAFCASPHEASPTSDVVQSVQASETSSDVVPTAHDVQPLMTNTKSTSEDRRLAHLRRPVIPRNKLTPDECAAILKVINSDEFKDLPPSQIVPRLADQGLYIACESTMRRLLRSVGQNTHRRLERAPQKRHKPLALKATAANQIYSWDITYLPTQIKGIYFYLYLFLDIFSRLIVGWQVYDVESAEHASALLEDICLRYGISKDQVTLHSDNGSPMKGATMLATLQRLGVMPSRSRPAVSNDNPFSESLFRTLKYRPDMPVKPFSDLVSARQWVQSLVNWYNYEHRHSAIGFVTPEQRHTGQDIELLQQRTAIYNEARQKNPLRWSKNIRNWNRVEDVHLNPDKPKKTEVKKPEK